MLSILIPIYNYDINQLVTDLVEQCAILGITYEVICFDDASNTSYKAINRSVQALSAVQYKELASNQGRSKIRNQLAEAAQYDYLLFMDCDSMVVNANYMENYYKHLSLEKVLYGGRCYSAKAPESSEFYFHWKYGREREQSNKEQRAVKPYHSFMTNNFLIPRALFLSIRFEEKLLQYGHEDTLFGMELKKRAIPILHLDNPLKHAGLEEVDTFVEKTEKGIENLYYLSKEHPQLETKLLRTFQQLKTWKLLKVVGVTLGLLQPYLIKQLKSKNPKLIYFDLFKLGLLIQCFNKQNEK